MKNSLPVNSVQDDPMRVVVLFSGGASGGRYLLSENSPESARYEIVAGIADSQSCAGIDVLKKNHVAVEVVDANRFRDNQTGESRYFKKLTSTVDQFQPDLLLLSGFMRIVKPPLLTKYEGQIINVHPADLRVKESGKRKYRGTNTVYRAITEEEEETRSTVHFVTAGVDEGPILVVSEPVTIDREMVRTFEKFDQEMVRNYADLIQERMKWSCDGPAIQKALNLIGNGEVKLSGAQVYLQQPSGFKTGYYNLKSDEIVPTEPE